MSSPLHDLRQTFLPPEWPQWLKLSETPGRITLTVGIAPDIRWLQGHFPGEPVLPGVVQTHWAAGLGRWLFAITAPFHKIDNLKFHQMIVPHQVLDLILEYRPEPPTVRFVYQAQDRMFSEGRIGFRAN